MRILRGPIWRNRDFVRLWAASTVSIFGALVTRTALPFAAIIVLGAGPIEIAVLRSLEFVAGLTVGLVAGAWVDRLPRRPIMIAADLGRALLLASVPASALLHVLGMPQLYGVAFLFAAMSTIFEVADRSFLPTVVERSDILPANSALTMSSAVAEFGAFGVSGFLVQLVTAPIAVLVGAVTFLWSALFLARIRSPEPAPAPRRYRESVVREIRDGLGLLLGDPILRPIALAGASVGGLFGIFGTTYLLFANQDLGLSPAVIGVVTGVGGAGALIGAMFASRLIRKFGLGRVLVWSLVLGSLGNAFIPLAPAALPLVAIACLLAQQLIADSAITVFEIGDVTVRQSLVPDRRLGRVNASVHVLFIALQLGGTVLGGVLAAAIGVRGALVLGSLGGLIGAAFIFFSPVRTLLEVPGPPVVEGLLSPVVAGENVPLGE
jgi:Na+/melibiose symporter-like transporter